nr:hypothetical protein [Allomuricauda sp.]
MKNLLKSFLTYLLLLCCTIGMAQTQLFSGKRTAGGFTGTAEYPYKMVDGDSIPDGAFLMYKSNVNALLKEKDSFFSFSGKFIEGYPAGFWKFQFGEFSSNNSSQVVGFQYRVNVSGIQNDAFGNLSNGKPDGDWTYKISRIENSEISEVLFQSKISYDEGIPQKSFQIENDSTTLIGRFLRDGFAHDVWVVYSDAESEPSESWHFTNGLLEKIEKTSPYGNLTLKVFNGLSDRNTSVVLDESYLKVVRWYLNKQQVEIEPKNLVMYQLLQQNAAQYKSLDDFFNDLGKSEFIPSFKVSVPFYPLDSLEIAQLKATTEAYKSGNEISSELLENPQFGLLSHSNPQAQYYYNVVERLHQDFLEPLGTFLEFDDKEIIEFVSRTELASQIWPNGLPQKRIQFSETNDAYASWELESSISYDTQEVDMDAVQQMALYAQKSLDTISKDLSDWLREAKQQQQYSDLEAQLVKETKILEKNIDSLAIGKSIDIKRALDGILETKENALKTYAEMTESDAKLEYGQMTLSCLKNLGKLALEVAKLPEKELIIQEKYQDAVWNPFTATIMDEAVKKRITSAYKNVIVPYLLTKVAEPVACKNVSNLTLLLDNTHNRLLELRDESTKKLERKLKKEQDPETVLELLGIVSNPKTEGQ